jgi:hypothetical protein
LQKRAHIQPRKGEVQQEEIGRHTTILRGKPIKKVEGALATLQHLQHVLQPMGMEHPRDAIHIRRVILHDSNDKQGVWGRGLHGSDVPGSIDHTAYVEKYTAIAQEMAVQRGSIVSRHPLST